MHDWGHAGLPTQPTGTPLQLLFSNKIKSININSGKKEIIIEIKERIKRHWERSIQPKFPGISAQNSMDRFCPTEKTGPPFEVDHFSRSDRSEFRLNGSRPLLSCLAEKKV